ncbi:CPBP family glutamic-type intramembrane protease [Marivirga arenosa]|uniref:CPBP family glutamic-type intramembrane protease n=1 Tax=Marivirga arenosa TaxID=3059076 RepID=A0AA51ZWY8_9BACT|nr:CPBP family glutamic-type intramembrane protease [Marivirga sp. BKB1-2]WNB18265.1 CPBP family glutamic-type intramembrane protease [Marivirga sp. BKB1-2]
MNIIKFIRNPKEKIEKDQSIFQMILEFIVLFFLCIGLGAIALFLTELLRNSGLIPQYVREYDETTKAIRSNILFVAILFPIMEELAFRLYLLRSNLNIFISSLFITHMISSAFIFQTSSFSLEEYGVLRTVISFSTAFLVLLIYRSKTISLGFKSLYFTSAFFFGLVHIYNYDYTNFQIFIFAILICTPQIIGGFIFGYTRIKYGIVGAIILHGLVNGVPQMIL